MKNRSWWIALGAAVLIGAVLLIRRPWTVREPLTSVPALSAAPDSEMLKMARAAFLACGAPVAPTTVVPNGKTATQEEMVAAHDTVKAFDEATTIYNQCLDTTAYQAGVQFKSVATDADTEALNSLQVHLHNEAIDRDQDLANRFNVQLRIFKARGH